MISQKELQFVNQYARHVPFPGTKYAQNAIDMMVKALENYKKNYENKSYNFIFSNGEEIEFKIFQKNLPHLLGMDYKNLTSDIMNDTCNNILGYDETSTKYAFDVLNRIIERADEVIKNDSDPQKLKILNYYKVMIKSIAFLKLTTFEEFNFGCVNFDKDIYNSLAEHATSINSNKFLFTKSNEAITPYFMMGIKMNEDSTTYIPETIIAPENFKNFIANQTLIVPIQVLVGDNYELNKICATNEEKLYLLNMYKSILSEYHINSFIDIYNDYENILKENSGRTLIK